MSTDFDQMVRKAVYILQFQSLRSKCSQYGTAAGSSQINRKKAIFHDIKYNLTIQK